jgi:hypothetical protein
MPTTTRDGITLAFEGVKAAARCKVPALHIAGTPPLNSPHMMNGMIEGFVRHHV